MNDLLRTVIKESIINAEWWKQALNCIDPHKYAPEDIFDLLLGPKESGTSGTWPEHFADYLIDLAVTKPDLRVSSYEMLEGHESKEKVIVWLADLSYKLANISEPYEPWIQRCWNSMIGIQGDLLKENGEIAWKSSTWEIVLDILNENQWPEEMVGLIQTISQLKTVETVELLYKIYVTAPGVGSWQRSVRQQLDMICVQQHDDVSLQQRACQILEEIMVHKVENSRGE